MKTVNKNLFFSGKNYLSIAILTITLIGIISTSIVTDYAVQAYNIQVTENSLVDISFFGNSELYQNFTSETFSFETSLPISQVFVSHKTYAPVCLLSTDDNVTYFHRDNKVQLYILVIDFSLFQTYPFNESVRNPHFLNNSGGVYISSHFIRRCNLNIGENFSLYDGYGHYEGGFYYVQQYLQDIPLIGELVVKNENHFMQIFGLWQYWELLSSFTYGIMLMDSHYYEEKFQIEEGEEALDLIDTGTVLNYIFDKTGVLEKRSSAITEIFTTIIDVIDSNADAIGYELSMPSEFLCPFLVNIQYYTNTFDRFRIFLILGSFPIFFFGWWVNKTSINLSLKSQLPTFRILQSKGVSKTDLRKKILGKSVIIGSISWIFALFLSQLLSLGLRYYLFKYEWTSFFSLNKVMNIPTLILLPIGIGISFLSTLSALNTNFRKDTNFLESDSKIKKPRLIRKQSKKRSIIFGTISLLSFFVYLFPIFGISVINLADLEFNSTLFHFLTNITSFLCILSLVAPFFFIIALIDLISLSTPEPISKSKKTKKVRKASHSYSRRIALRKIFRNMKTYTQFIFIMTLSITLIIQSTTYNHIVELNHYHTNLITDGNGFALDYVVLNRSYSHFQQVAQDVGNNEQLQSLIYDDASLIYARNAEYLNLYMLSLINTSEWEKNIKLPRNWISSSSDEVYSQLKINGSILVSDQLMEEKNYQIGDAFTFGYENIHGQQVEKEVQIIGYYTRFPLSNLNNPPHNRRIIADISFFQDVEISSVKWIFYPNNSNTNLYELYKLVQGQIYESDSSGGLIYLDSLDTEKIDFPEPSIPYSKFLEIEAIGLAIIILIGLTLLLKQQFEATSTSRNQFRMKGMSKNILRKKYIHKFLTILLLSFLIFIPAFAISLQSIVALNLTIAMGIPYVISVPYIGILLVLGAFFGALLVAYSVIVWRGINNTDRKEKGTLTIS